MSKNVYHLWRFVLVTLAVGILIYGSSSIRPQVAEAADYCCSYGDECPVNQICCGEPLCSILDGKAGRCYAGTHCPDIWIYD